MKTLADLLAALTYDDLNECAGENIRACGYDSLLTRT